LELGNPIFDRLDIRKDKLGIDNLNISLWVNSIFYMNNIVVLECPNNMYDCITLTDICEKLIAEPFTFAGASDETCNIDESDSRGIIFWAP
jgi:hypothetical protein